MGSRGRSIRVRIYFLVAIPLITMLGLFGVFAYASVTSWLNLDRAPNLINATSVPITQLVNLLQAERQAAVVYLSHPDNSNLSAYKAAITATKADDSGPLAAALDSPGTKDSENGPETAAISKLTVGVNGMTGLRTAVSAGQITPLDAFEAYTKIITDAPEVFQSEASSLTNTTAASQGLALIATVNAHEDLQEQDAVLAGALAAGSLTPADRVVFDQAAGRQQDATLLFNSLFQPDEAADYNTTLNELAPQSMQNQLTTIEQAVEGGETLRQLGAQGVNSGTWQALAGTVATASYKAGVTAAAASVADDSKIAASTKERVGLAAGVGVIGLILTLIVTILLGRSINRRLSFLRRSALTLAEEQLPAVVARLRRGEDVDVAAEAPPLRVGTDEIGQVGQAFDTVRQTAIRAAVEEARLRQGVNDVFRNLARRSQSLLQRQLTVLDGMERRASDPDALDDLFRLDHLTTRMRRHAEGLIILSGAAPGRSWSAPVRLVDVMRGAVAEVEDYARVTVSTQSRAAVAGSAVTDMIHLLAELIENATTLSPPFTQVRVSGDIVANGFAIEIEDRGLGMTPTRMRELNERLANPPDINPANTEQLGLFVVGNLARRHGVSVTLQPSPYGGTTAVVLIPQRLVVDDAPAAITAGHGAAGTAAYGGASANAAFNGDGAFNGDAAFNGADGPGMTKPMPSLSSLSPPPPPSSPKPTIPHTPISSPPDLDNIPLGNGGHGPASGIRISGPVRGEGRMGDRRGGRHGSDGDVPVVTGIPVSRPKTPPPFDAASSFDVFTPQHRPEPDGGGYNAGNIGRDPEGYPGRGGTEQGTASEDYKGLPRRVRQANLAPQLRPQSAAGTDEPTGVPPAATPSPSDLRNTLSAMQRGWQQGRMQPQRETTEGSVDGE
jgi:signal transduction histidine kinase